MATLDHEHHIISYEGPLLTPQEKERLHLCHEIHYYKNGRCSIGGCSYFTYEPIVQTRRGPRIFTGNNSQNELK